MNIVIVGHIDHGKSTLIGRLLYDTNSIPDSIIADVRSQSGAGEMEFAYLLDCLEEERAQNITIDTTRTFFRSNVRAYTIIDAPGHKEFVKNMVSGASVADAAVLMIDVLRGMEEQTRRHAYILQLLGVKKIIVAINKMDGVNFSKAKFVALREEVLSFLEKLQFRPAEVIPIAAKTGDNVVSKSAELSWYPGPSLLEALDALPQSEDQNSQEMRFQVQDIYDLEGTAVAVGRVESGVLARNVEVTLMPSGKRALVRDIRVMEGSRAQAETGKCVGVLLDPPLRMERGDVVFIGRPPKIADALNTLVFSMGNRNISRGDVLACQCGTQTVNCSVEAILEKIDSSSLEIISDKLETLEPTQVGKLALKFSEPLIYEEIHRTPAFGRLVLVQEGDICAAGII